MRKLRSIAFTVALLALAPQPALAQAGGGAGAAAATTAAGTASGNAVDLSLGNLPPAPQERGFPWGLLGLLGLIGLIPRKNTNGPRT